MRLFIATWLLLLGITVPAEAHDARPVFIELHEAQSGHFNLQWKVPSSVPRFALPTVQLPGGCVPDAEPVLVEFGDAFVSRQNISCSEPLYGKRIGLRYPQHNPSLSTLYKLDFVSGGSFTRVLSPEENTLVIPEQQTSFVVARDYTILGVEHILKGIDHILFVLGLVLLVGGVRLLIKTITAFTVAHSITLALSALELFQVPIAPTEAVIALSIMFVAFELVEKNRGRMSLAQHKPWLVAFCFGLLHGFGFASALSEIGLPQGDISLALLFFNVGVEIGQMLFVATVLVIIKLLGMIKIRWPAWSLHLPAYAIGSLAAFWVIQRCLVIF